MMSAPGTPGAKTPYLTTSLSPKPKAWLPPLPKMTSINKQLIQLQAVVPFEQGGQRLDQVAAQLFGEFSRSRLATWIKEGRLTVDGTVARPRDTVHAGSTLVLDAEQEAQGEWVAQDIELNIVYEDEHLLSLIHISEPTRPY